MKPSLVRLAGVVVALALVAVGCSDDDEAGSSRWLAEGLDRVTSTTEPAPNEQPGGPKESGAIDWHGKTGVWEQGVLDVPLDHDDPDGPTIEIALIRRSASDPAARIGPLLLNPGGPGASGIELAELSRFLFPQELFERFDIIGFDPRGVAASTPVMCGDDAFLDQYNAYDPVPDSPEETAEAERLIQEFASNCETESGELLPHLTTVATARDMDLIREALGEEQISYLGFSYGTFLGATYIELFPDRVRAAVLDGAYSRSLTAGDMAEGQARGFERSIDAFLAWCEPERCDLADTGDPDGELQRILDAIDAQPLPTNDDRELTVGLAWTGVIMAMYLPAMWPILDAALVRARDQGNGSGLISLADQYNDRAADGSYNNSTFAFTAISCMDERELTEAEEAEVAARVLEVAPRIGPVFVSLPSPCNYWPVTASPPTGPFSAPDAPPLVVVATTGDPATPYDWGVTLADELETATLLTVEGDGHGAYGMGNSCVDDFVDAYLLSLKVPSHGSRC